MAISIVRLGTDRKNSNELRLGTVRKPPRGVRKENFSKLNYYDVWMPILSPSLELMKFALKSKDEKSWNQFIKKFKAEMKRPDAVHALELVAALSHKLDLSLGCYCEDENHCHRSVLRELLKDHGAKINQ